jgi:ankyrin repeat protein
MVLTTTERIYKYLVRFSFLLLADFLFCISLHAQVAPAAQRDCDTPLIAAIHKQDIETARKLIDSGSDLNAKVCGEGETALTESIAEGQSVIARELIRKGANVNLADNKHSSPLMYAAFNCDEGTVSLLLKYRAIVNAIDSDGSSALMNAAYQCSDGRIVLRLIRQGAKVNLQSNTGNTALTLGVEWGNESAIIELIAAGANLDIQNKKGETAASIAKNLIVGRKRVHDRIVTLLSALSE